MDEIGILPEDRDRVEKARGLFDRIQPRIKSDMLFKGNAVYIDGGTRLFDDPKMPDLYSEQPV
jgi:hypothetical protein